LRSPKNPGSSKNTRVEEGGNLLKGGIGFREETESEGRSEGGTKDRDSEKCPSGLHDGSIRENQNKECFELLNFKDEKRYVHSGKE